MKGIIKSNRALKKYIKDISLVAGMFWDRGWAEKNAGNISINITELISDVDLPDLKTYPLIDLAPGYPELKGFFFIISGTGKRMRELARKPYANTIIIGIDESGHSYRLISESKNQHDVFPTSELPTHLKIHRMIKERGSDEKVVTHTHASELIAITQIKEYCNEERLNNLLWGMHPETIIFIPKGIGFVKYQTPGTNKIADETLKALQEHDVALWEKHGIFAIGKEIMETFDLIDILAKSAGIFFLCKNAGLEPEGISKEQLEELKKIVF